MLRGEEVPAPVAGPGEVLVEIRAAALNHLDLWVRRGLPVPIEMPHVGGADFAGVVRAYGPGTTGFEAGDAVVGYPLLGYGRIPWPECGERPSGPAVLLGEQRNGAFCELLALPAANLVRKPATLSFEQAAALPVAFVTAFTMLHERARLRAGETVLVLGASGGVGLAAVQIARHAGARVLAVTRSPDKASALASLDAEPIVAERPLQVSAEVMRMTDRRGADVVFESVGGPLFEAVVGSAAYAGRIVSCGATTGRFGRIDLATLFARQLEIHGVTLGPRRVLERLLGLAAEGRLAPAIDRVLPLDECRAAHELLEAAQVTGRIVLRVSG